VFRNPPGDYAARLIEACGLKGKAIGGARISSKHANFIVNEGGARAADIEALILLAERSVLEKFGVVLEREVRIVGDRDEGGGLRAEGKP
jgi:UDP-N-acetylmuramate dehydrogenase